MNAHASPDLARLQITVAEHVTYAGATRCAVCKVEDCPPRTDALQRLRSLGVLPRRVPGATRPELVGARRIHPT